MGGMMDANEEALFERVLRIVEAARARVARAINTAMVQAYWTIGREIVEHEQGGKERADYGEQVVNRLSQRLTARYGKGFSRPNIWRMRQFFLTFPAGSALLGQASNEGGEILSALPRELDLTKEVAFPATLSWTHYCILMRIENPGARAFYEIEAAREGWSTRELERQVGSLLYERLALSRDKEAVLDLAREGQQISKPADVIKDPFVLEFLGLEERPDWLERDLEQAIIDRLQQFMLEMGKGFCFVARQRRLTLDGDHFFVDLVFYNRLLRCFVLIDLKMSRLTHQDLGQMMMYVNWFDRFQRESWEQPTVGIVLCSDKNDAMVRITLPEGNEQVHAARYQVYLPSEAELRDAVISERERIEQALRLRGEE